MKTLLLFLSFPYMIIGNITVFRDKKEERKIDILADLVISNLKNNGWNNVIIFGHFPNDFYFKLINSIPFTFVTSNTNDDDYYIEDTVPYHSNTLLLNCIDFGHFEESLLQIMSLAYWHPHANVYLYYHSRESKVNIARIFFIFWYYRACNVLLIQYDDSKELFYLSYYTPYISDGYDKVHEKFGCWTGRKLGMPIYTFDEAFVCEEGCHNVTISSKLRATSLGTCIGVFTHEISYSERNAPQGLNLFEDKGKNFHRFDFRAFTTEVLPFMHIIEHPNNTYSMASRDGMIWNTLAKLLNFTINFTSSEKVMKKPFDFEINIQQIFAVAHRKGDLFLNPIYQFDVIVVELDYTFAYKESGVCFMAHRAEFETILFDLKTLIENYYVVVQFGICFFSIWFIFCLYSATEAKEINMDFIGKNFLNSVRSILLINLFHPPKRTSFRLFLTIMIWSFFVINFATQAAIISFFTAFKRGREINTFEDVVEKGYRIEGMASPDVVLPDTEERFRKINSKLSPIRNIFECVKALSNDSYRFCLVDCSVGRYLERNMLNEKGEQYLHIAKDRVHSHYLNFIFPKHSVITDNFNKYMMILFEAGLIKKWEEYKYNDIKEEVLTKPLGMDDVNGIFKLYGMLLITTTIAFFVEICKGNFEKIKTSTLLNIKNWKRTNAVRNIIKTERKQKKIKRVHNFTQT